ncbi:MAG TPA: S41 family peptidase [Candidatus Babeliales bacterium]|nr:S41 family peptidase [Candidatus Babeliales bacterium]
MKAIVTRLYRITILFVLLVCLHSSDISAGAAVIKPTATQSIKIDIKQEEKISISFDEAIFNWVRVLAEVLQATGQKHYKVADPETCMIKAIDAFLTFLDPHSNFLDPKTYKAILESTSGEFFGIGIVIDNTRQQKDKFLLIIDTIAEGPSDLAGVKALDKIVEIDGQSLEGMTTEEATLKLKGERNTTVHVKILRDNHPDIISLDIKRDIIKEQNSLCFYIEEHNVYYVSLSSFTETAATQIETLLKKAQQKPYKGLILDLRNNSGGLLTSAIDIAGLFLEKGSEVVSTKNKFDKVTERYTTNRQPSTNNAPPIFILINNYTASAAEILAGCLMLHSNQYAKAAGDKKQKQLMVFLVGTRTFGKGSVQEVIPVSNNCAMKITTSLYFLPFNTAIQGLGIEPDFDIQRRQPPTDQMIWFNQFYGSERALTNSIKSPDQKDQTDQEKKKKTDKKADVQKTWSERAKEALLKDNQFRETLSLINIFDAIQTYSPERVATRPKAVEYMSSLYVTSEKINLTEIKI